MKKVLVVVALVLMIGGVALAADWNKADVNNDGVVNILDMIKVATALGSTPDSGYWNPAADVNGDGVVNILDLIVVDRHFGESK